MKIALLSKLKLGFVDGSIVKPSTTTTLFMYWSRCNDIVTSWILNTVSTEIRQSIMYIDSASAI